MALDDSTKARAERLSRLTTQNEDSEIKLEIIDANLSPTNTLSIASLDDCVRFSEYSSAFYENGQQLIAWDSLKILFQEGTLVPGDLKPSSNSKNAFLITHYDIDLKGEKFDFQISFHPDGSLTDQWTNNTGPLTPEEIQSGKSTIRQNVKDFDPKQHQPITLTFHYDDMNNRWQTQSFAIDKLQKDYRQTKDGSFYKPGDFEPARSRNRFHVQYRDPKLTADTIQVTLKTQNPYNPEIKDSTKVTLRKIEGQPGLYRSDALILTSLPEVDRFPTQGHKDNKPGDTTVLASVGSVISVSYQNKETKALVPVKKIMKTRPYIFNDRKGNPIATAKEVKNRSSQIQSYVAPAGILVRTLETENLPAPLFDPKKEDENIWGKIEPTSQTAPAYYIDVTHRLSDSEKVFLARYTGRLHPEENSSVIRMIIAGDTHLSRDKEGLLGRAFPFGLGEGNNSFFAARLTQGNVFGHETVHLHIGKPPNHDGFGHYQGQEMNANLMSRGVDAHLAYAKEEGKEGLPSSLATINPEQIEAMLQSPLLKDPTPETNQLPSQTQQAPASPRP